MQLLVKMFINYNYWLITDNADPLQQCHLNNSFLHSGLLVNNRDARH